VANNLILRTVTSPYGDTTKGNVLSQGEVDNNFIYLKGQLIDSVITDGDLVSLNKKNGETLSFSLIADAKVVSITYSDLMTAMNNSTLFAGQQYLITDFKMVTYIQFTGGGIGDEEKYTGATEPMLVQATSIDTLANQITSIIQPSDIIRWLPTFSDRDWDGVLNESTGIITYREDPILKLSRDFDWRNIIFRRWETISGSGVFNSITNTGFNSLDYPPFTSNGDGSFSCYIGSPLLLAATYGYPYYLDNTIGKNSTSGMNILFAFANNIENFFDANGYMSLFYNNNISNEVTYNNVDAIINNNVSMISENFGNAITDNSHDNLIIRYNGCRGINSNQINGSILGNNSWNINGNINLNPNSFINENTCSEIRDNINCNFNSNEISHMIKNTGFTLTQNVGAGFSDNISDSISFITGSSIMLIENCVISGNVIDNSFNSNLKYKDFVPTTGMSSNLPTVTLYDQTNGHVEQKLIGGIITYQTF